MSGSGHRWLSAVALSVALLAGAGSAQAAAGHRLGIAPSLPSGARSLGTLAGSSPLRLTVALSPRDAAGLAAYAAAVSTPGSALFRHYLSVAGFRQRFAPSGAQIATVQRALRADGLHPEAVTANGLAVSVSGTATTAARAFSTGFRRVALRSGRHAYVDTAAPELTGALASTVQAVAGLDSLPADQPADTPHVDTGGPEPCQDATTAQPTLTFPPYTADQLASAYGLSSFYGQGDEGAGQTVALFELGDYADSDISAYADCYGATNQVNRITVDGGAPADPNEEETTLDIEDVAGFAPRAKIDVYVGPNTGSGELDTYSAIVNADTAQVMSTSWGACEGSGNVGSGNQLPTETLLQEAAVQGQGVFSASGDHGAEDCSGSNRTAVDFPSSSPFVTAVGGTTMTAIGPPPSETGWKDSGGGISRDFSMPSYQSGAPAGLHVLSSSSSGTPCRASSGDCRELPDVSALADPRDGYEIYFGGSWESLGGTSAAAPLWAAFTALANASSACAGTSIGFANPLLYALAAGGEGSDFNDILSGSNDMTGRSPGTFAASSGYDMVTGLGTPIGGALGPALCAARAGAVTVTNPGDQSEPLGATVDLPIDASDATGSALTYSASGLPAGLAIDKTTGVITGTAAAGGSFTATVTATDGNGYSGQTTFGFVVTPRTSTPQTTVMDGATRAAWSGTETSGATAYASTTIPASAAVPSGTVTVALYGTADCSSSPLSTQTLSMTGGTVPDTALTDALADGSYGYLATYSGDASYTPASGHCTPFQVLAASAAVTTTTTTSTTTPTTTTTSSSTATVITTSATRRVSAPPSISLTAPVAKVITTVARIRRLTAALSGASRVADRHPFIVALTVVNRGTVAAAPVLAGLTLPSGTSVSRLLGARQHGRLLVWRRVTLTPGARVTFRVDLRAGPRAVARDRLEAIVLDPANPRGAALALGQVELGHASRAKLPALGPATRAALDERLAVALLRSS